MTKVARPICSHRARIVRAAPISRRQKQLVGPRRGLRGHQVVGLVIVDRVAPGDIYERIDLQACRLLRGQGTELVGFHGDILARFQLLALDDLIALDFLAVLVDGLILDGVTSRNGQDHTLRVVQ
jgi:hypothetical protein